MANMEELDSKKRKKFDYCTYVLKGTKSLGFFFTIAMLLHFKDCERDSVSELAFLMTAKDFIFSPPFPPPLLFSSVCST